MTPDLVRRQVATQATMAKYRNKQFSWDGGVTCVHMARSHLRKMGHKLETLPRLRSIVAANRALKERGWATVTEMLDAQPSLMRVAPAAMLLGDIAVVASPEGLGSIFVCAAANKLIGWREDYLEMVVLDVPFDQIEAAWRA